jgi:hypothetical protein
MEELKGPAPPPPPPLDVLCPPGHSYRHHVFPPALRCPPDNPLGLESPNDVVTRIRHSCFVQLHQLHGKQSPAQNDEEPLMTRK